MKKFALNLILIFLVTSVKLNAQDLLSKNVSIDVNRQRVDRVLELLSNKGRFYFSYSSSIIRKDSIVSINVYNKPLKEVLDQLFGNGYEFVENGNYIIIRRAPVRLTVVTNRAVKEERVYSVSGFVYDEQTGHAIRDASVYEKKLLASTMTTGDGYFKLKLKSGRRSTAELTLSKEFYADTSVIIEPRHSQELTITMMPLENEAERTVISPEDYEVAQIPPPLIEHIDTVVAVPVMAIADSGKVETTKAGRFLLSAKQKIQSINLKKFFTSRPYQMSLVPGLGTHGKLSGQVVNNVSINAIGGYTAGTNGVELGGLFNIDKKSVRYFQAGGLFNIVGGSVTGFQAAGIHNLVLDSVVGVQAGGVSNLVRGKLAGVQLAGVYNHVTDTVKGLQAAGLANFSKRKISGVQVAGIANVSNKEMNGVQISGMINYAKRLKGVQIGLINIADTSEGYSIGLINIVLKGYHKLTFFSNELTDVNVAFKTGNSKLYSILHAGFTTDETEKAFVFGYGLGTELSLNKKKTLTVNPELYSQTMYLGAWDNTNVLNRLELNLNVKLGRYISLFAGPSVSLYLSDQNFTVKGYRSPGPPKGYRNFTVSDRLIGWFGWNAGINFF
ncbi:secretin and TonB N-terminal domain-containing protein [Terrimonas sp. NA20]|uniref:Secretin and TonB N-terminal domain-containing protein n=1 Tax=Terrimonas ginsenosidimutans TaxID=2908004 RepID=A0ABS9KZQ0_9BACT|nr:STN and carboxypeptidase regulatory-like domain-containing protein [Terrimonas ginsenosidimutans]MCG2617810.1 secretin and TonB N-terminal domain-containing protein [Terrimonas ginsenosidimutans]